MSLTEDLGRFVADVFFERLPAEAVEVARVGFIDCIATMIAGAGNPAPHLLRKALDPTGGDASLYLDRLKHLECLSARDLTKVS
jgi:2-methylcitrate dehydratase PrpD